LKPGSRPSTRFEAIAPNARKLGDVMDYEQLLETFYKSFLRPGDVAIDVGAHTGRHTLPIECAVTPGGKVFAFEPLPSARTQLERAVAGRSPSVTVFPYALADRDGEDEFVVAVDLPAYSGLKTRIYDHPTRVERIRVDVRALDGIFGDTDRLDYIKIDAEGGELAILRGAMGLLERFAPVVTFEFGANSLASYGITVDDMADFWADKRYVIYDILGRPLDSATFVKSAIHQEVWDYVALPMEKVDVLLKAWKGGGSVR
jgi:FkbM family methyltransferase